MDSEFLFFFYQKELIISFITVVVIQDGIISNTWWRAYNFDALAKL